MKQTYRWLRLTALGAVLALTTTTTRVRALPKFQLPRAPIDLEGREIDCPDFLEPQVELVRYTFIVGYPLVGFTVKISAEHVKFHGKGMSACGFPDYIAPLPAFSWSIASQPIGSVVELDDDDGMSLTPRLPVDKEGQYVVRLTVCPGADGCTIQPPGSHFAPVHVDTQFVDIPIEARESAPLAPETTPAVPTSEDAGHTTPVDRCNGLIPGILAKQWWAVEQIETPYDYRQLDGFVRESRVARMDDPLNHGWPGPVVQDATFHVVPDPKHSDLLFEPFNTDNPQAIEVEWEGRSIPERYRPTPGDRVSIFGYWDTDCGHDRPEIHPPVGIAVHRPRPIRIPNGATFPELGGQAAGTGIYVPGIITDIFFSEDGGDLVDCDTGTGLANANLVPGPNGTMGPDCVPAPSLDHVFEFDIYLPRNPRATMQQAGFDVPPVPLYILPETVPGGPEPEIEIRPDAQGLPAYLHVTLDLRGYTGQSYADRIVAGWVLPSADNWGLARYKLSFLELEVSDDGDGAARGDGDWRLWVNTNNASNESYGTQEWVEVIHRDIDNGVENFGGRPWATGLPGEPGAPALDRSLGPDLLRYPAATAPFPTPRDYGILFHSTGYEADTLTDDDAGTVLEARVPRGGPPSSRQNQCEPSGEQLGGLTYSDCVRYTAVFETVPGPALAPAVLSRAAQNLADQYVLRCRPEICKGDVLDAIVAAPLEASAVDPLDVPLTPGSKAREFTDFGPFEPAERKTTSLTGITVADFYRDIIEARKVDRARLDRTLKDLHGLLAARIADKDLSQDAVLDAQVLRASRPPNLWAKYFSDLPSPRPDPRGSKARFTGAGSFGVRTERVNLSKIALHCDALRRPNSLSVAWGKNRFNLNLVLESECTHEPRTRGGIRIQEGAGIGRLNGVPGAFIRWRLVDRGAGSEDEASITIWTGDGASMVLDASGKIRPGIQLKGTLPIARAQAGSSSAAGALAQ